MPLPSRSGLDRGQRVGEALGIDAVILVDPGLAPEIVGRQGGAVFGAAFELKDLRLDRTEPRRQRAHGQVLVTGPDGNLLGNAHQMASRERTRNLSTDPPPLSRTPWIVSLISRVSVISKISSSAPLLTRNTKILEPIR